MISIQQMAANGFPLRIEKEEKCLAHLPVVPCGDSVPDDAAKGEFYYVYNGKKTAQQGWGRYYYLGVVRINIFGKKILFFKADNSEFEYTGYKFSEVYRVTLPQDVYPSSQRRGGAVSSPAPYAGFSDADLQALSGGPSPAPYTGFSDIDSAALFAPPPQPRSGGATTNWWQDVKSSQDDYKRRSEAEFLALPVQQRILHLLGYQNGHDKRPLRHIQRLRRFFDFSQTPARARRDLSPQEEKQLLQIFIGQP